MIEATENNAAWAFLFEQLERGHELSHIASNELKDRSGKIFIIPSHEAGSTILDNISQGGYFSYSDSLSEIIKYIDRGFRSEGKVIVCENELAKKGDKFIERTNFNRFFVGDNVYFFLSSFDFEEKKIRDLINLSSNACSFRGFIYGKDLSHLLRNDPFLTSAQITSFSSSLESVILDSFDGEAFLVWEKKSQVHA